MLVGVSNPPSLIPALWNIGILLHTVPIPPSMAQVWICSSYYTQLETIQTEANHAGISKTFFPLKFPILSLKLSKFKRKIQSWNLICVSILFAVPNPIAAPNACIRGSCVLRCMKKKLHSIAISSGAERTCLCCLADYLYKISQGNFFVPNKPN